MDNRDQLIKEMKKMQSGAEGMIKQMDLLTRQSFKDLSPEEGVKLAKYMNDAKMGDKLKAIKKDAEKLKKEFNVHIA